VDIVGCWAQPFSGYSRPSDDSDNSQMEKLAKTTGIFIGVGILNTIVFTVYLNNTGLPSGEVGMLPLLIAMESGIAIILSTVIYLLIRSRIEITAIRVFLMYQLVYLVTLFFSGVNPFDKNLTDVFKTLTWLVYLFSFLVTIGLTMTTKLINRLRTNEN
jgi:hypothetical protein